jgi:ribonuclease R
MEIDVAIRSHEVPEAWPEAVLAQVGGLPGQVPRGAARDRLDLRHLPLVTIDGADARDFDDAVYCERTPKGWKLYVAIADVSHYVCPETALDEEARLRGTSVYFPGRVVPMLPEKLSNGLCSLNPDVDRLCMVCEMFVDREGRISRSRFASAIMHSRARLTYDEVAAVVVAKDPATRQRLDEVVPHLDQLYALFWAFRTAREKRGAMDLDTTENRIVFGADKKIERVEPVQRNDAHKIIEECMVAANIAAARYLAKHKMPLLYRVHDRPPPDKLADLRAFLGELGLRLGGGDKPDAGHFAALLRRVAKRPDVHLIQTVLLRSMAQAVYAPDNLGHFGLGLEFYAHFTSPIRRYPDLLVHRAIRHVLEGGVPADFLLSHEQMLAMGEHCSMTERRADDATRDATDWLKCEFMLDKVGDLFEGTLTSVTSFGIFVELDSVHVEGLVHVTSLGNDYFHFDPAHHRLTGDRTGKVFRLGDRTRVKVVRVDLEQRRIDFELPEAEPARRGGGRRSRSSRRRSR